MNERLSPPPTDLSLSEIAKLNWLVENTITVVPRVNDKPFGEQCIISAFGSDQVTIIFDEKSNSYWVRALKTQKRNLKSRLCSRSGGNFTCRDVGEDARDPTEKTRLEAKIAKPLVGSPSGRFSSSSGRAFTPPPSPPAPTTSDAIHSPGHSPLFSISGDEGTNSPVAASSKRTERRDESSLTASRDSPATDADRVKFECTTEEFTRPQRKKARFASVAESSGSTFTPAPTANAALQLLPPPYPRFDDMPFEILAHILRLCFEELESPEAHVAMLHKLYWLGRHPRDVINKLPELWTNVHPSSPTGFIEYSLKQASYHLISVYYKPKPKSFTNSALSEERWQEFHKFLRLVGSQSNRWERMDMVVTPDSLESLTTALESPVPNLRSLSAIVTAAPWSTPLALPMAPSLRSQVDRRLNLLAGERQSLQHLRLKNVPARFDPSAFAGLVSLSLADGTRMRYTEVIAFLGSSNNLRTLSLVNLRWLDHLRAPAANNQGLSLLHLEDVTLVESLEHTGLTNLLYHIDIRTCHRLHLHTLATLELLGQRLAEKVVPIVEKILPALPHTSLDIRHHLNSVEMSWEGRKTPQDSDGEQEMCFYIGFSSNNPNRSDQLFSFIKRVLDLTGSSAGISLEIHDSLSGIAPVGHGLGSIMAIPTLSTEILRRLDITEVSASFAEGYLGYMKDFLIEDRRPRFPHLRSVQLRYIPSSQVVVQPCSWAQHPLDTLLNSLGQVYLQVTVEEDLFEEARLIITLSPPGAPPIAEESENQGVADE